MLEPDVRSYREVSVRAKTLQVNAGRTTASFQALANHMFSRTIGRLQAEHLPTARTRQCDYSFVLPNQHSSPKQLAIFRAIYECPMTVTNADLGKVFNMQLSTLISPPTPNGAHFYMRSFRFSGKEFRKVIGVLGEYDEVKEWKRVANLFAPRDMDDEAERDDLIEDIASANAHEPASLPSTIRDALKNNTSTPKSVEQLSRGASANASGEVYFTVRYLGRTTGPNRPIDRFMDDLLRKKYGIYPEFMQVVDRLYPAVADAAEVHLLTDASLGAGDHTRNVAAGLNRSNQDDRERFLIELFDHNTLLNRQHGGYFSQYIAREKDVDLFLELDVKFYLRLSKHAQATPVQTFADITQHFKMVKQWSNDNSGTTGTSRHRYTDALRQVTTQQAQPLSYKSKFTILAILGKDITMDNYLLARPFFGGESQAAELVSSNIHRMNEAEDSNYSASAFNASLFPFVDLWNWLRHIDIGEACEFLRQYFEYCRPLIMVSLGREVNELTRGDFKQHRLSFPSSSFLEFVGEPTVQSYNITPGQDCDMSFINVPHFHPGADKYTARQAQLRRVLDMTWRVTYIIGDVLLNLIEKHSDNIPSRKALCQEAVHFVKTHQKYTAFWKQFNEVKAELRSVLGATGPNDGVRPVLNQEGRIRMLALGQAEHEPESEERREQLEKLWEKNVPDLHLVVAHTDQNRDDWINEFLLLDEGQFFFMQVLNRLPRAQYIDHLLRAIQPAWAEDTSWMDATEKRHAAILRCGVWFHRQKKDTTKTKSWYPDVYTSAYDMQGRQVGVGTTGAIRLYWRKDDGTNWAVQIRVKLAIPPPGQLHASRSIHFTRHGIDVREADGTAFRNYTARTDTEAKASIPVNLLAGTKGAFNTSVGGQATLDLWKAVRLARGKVVPQDVVAKEAKEWKVPKGVAGISRNATTEKPRQNRPPVEGDANYPLSVWLDERFPNGGTLRTISANRLPDSTEDLQHLIAFLRLPAWINHPHVSDWLLPNLERESGGGPDIALLEKNIRILRATEKKRTERSNPHPGTGKMVQHKETIIEVGPPNSASAEPFPKKAPGEKRKAIDDGDDGDDVNGWGGDYLGGTSGKPSSAQPLLKKLKKLKTSAVADNECDDEDIRSRVDNMAAKDGKEAQDPVDDRPKRRRVKTTRTDLVDPDGDEEMNGDKYGGFPKLSGANGKKASGRKKMV